MTNKGQAQPCPSDDNEDDDVCVFYKEVLGGQFYVMRDWWCYFSKWEQPERKERRGKSLFATEQQENEKQTHKYTKFKNI